MTVLSPERKTSDSLKETVRLHDVFVIHAIHANSDPISSPLKENATWQDKMDIIIALAPQISCSTIKAGDDPSKMRSRMGFILNAGDIVSASPYDAATFVVGERTKPVKKYSIQEAIEKRDDPNEKRGTKYNEIVIDSPKIAGIYYNLDEQYEAYRSDDITEIEKVTDYAKKHRFTFVYY